MLTPTEVKKLHQALTSTKDPLFFFHDDPDGLASFLLCYRYTKCGAGIPIKAKPRITTNYLNRLEEHRPDTLFVLDIAMMDQEFIDSTKTPIIWVDHHAVQDRDGVEYLNPQTRGVNIPTPELIWQAIGDERPQDLWIATVGAIGDWHFPPYAQTFQQAYPQILPPTISTAEDALFTTPLGTLVKSFSFALKGPTRNVKKTIKALTTINDPYEILEQRTKAGKHVWENYKKINKDYEALKNAALKHKPKGKLFVWTYKQDRLSLTKDLSNELLYHFKDKVIILGREKSGEYRCSLRAPSGVRLATALNKALRGIEGYGGGHEQACGAAIKKEDWRRFLENLKEELKLN
ncbi:hypothetical protein D6825_03975 [Candidatus Woesearchaeota archaeon]|nr:MAG: hypothetical protein D6825_03975 [Candidatus Woesearchaeota archaeon]